MDRLLILNYGQHMLYSYLCISLTGQGYELTRNQLSNLLDLIIELTHISNYETHLQCPDYMIMVNPENSFQIFCDFWEENRIYFVESL
jgi:hypothetical protein